MPTSTSTLSVTTAAMHGGVDAVPPRGPTYRVTFTGSWAVGDTWTMNVTSTIGDLTLGFGNISDSVGTYGYVLNQKVYAANGDEFDFSSPDTPTGWERQDVGAGTISFTSQYGALDACLSFSAYQGKLAVFGRRSIQIWEVDADPNNYALFQTLTEVGTVAAASVGSLGQLDTLFLSDSGFRSLRTRETSLNAFSTDVGSPIDKLVVASLEAMSESNKALANFVVEPSGNRYWCYVPTPASKVYVLSYFPSSKIQAWSTFVPTYVSSVVVTYTSSTAEALNHYFSLRLANGTYQQINVNWDTDPDTTGVNLKSFIDSDIDDYVAVNNNGVVTLTPNSGVPGHCKLSTFDTGFVGSVVNNYTAFVPTKMLVYKGQVFARDADAIYQYGGSSGTLYDGAVVTVELPWLDHGDPTSLKKAKAFDLAVSGSWTLQASMDPITGTLETVATIDGVLDSSIDSTYDRLQYVYQSAGTHFKAKIVSSDFNAGKPVLSGLTFRYEKAS